MALEEMLGAFSIKEFLLRNSSEVKGMVFSEWNEQALLEKHYRMQRLEGMREGKREVKLEIAAKMLRLGDPVEKVAACCGLGEDEVRSLAEGAPVH